MSGTTSRYTNDKLQSSQPHHITRAKEISSCSHDETINWMRSLNMDDSIPSFQNNQINGYDLCLLTSEELKSELGVFKLHERNIILRQIRIHLLDQCT